MATDFDAQSIENVNRKKNRLDSSKSILKENTSKENCESPVEIVRSLKKKVSFCDEKTKLPISIVHEVEAFDYDDSEAAEDRLLDKERSCECLIY